ncbi:kinase-like protein [Nemania sp. FL0916]|nr:kinase-like protein [Nemania sp. FL0916]
MDSVDDSAPSRASTDDEVQSVSRSSQAELRDRAESMLGSEDGVSIERHRNMMLATLLEDYYRSRALEFLNATESGQRYTRQSQEVEAIARRLFGRASQVLSPAGLVSSRATSDESRGMRHQYLSGLENLLSGGRGPSSTMFDTIGDLVSQPTNDLQLTVYQPSPPVPQSHYRSSFREDRLLGKGGFGKVYQCFNLLDQKTYAVKKIVLPPRLVKHVSDGNHDDLEHVLREVKAMAVLDHPNIVRYHATWFEKPQQSPALLGGLESTMSQIQRRTQQLLLDSHAYTQDAEQESSLSGGIVFGEDTPSHASVIASDPGTDHATANRGWSEDVSSGIEVVETTSASTSSIFAGGETDREASSHGQTTLDGSECALYIQMSMYPMTLAQFLSPPTSTNTELRHCFHLSPTLRLMLSIHDGLQYIHSKGLIHRDIKPGNIFLSASTAGSEGGCCEFSCRLCRESCQEGPPKPRWLNPRIGDFGLVHQLAQGEVPSSPQTSPASNHDAGTVYYQPPRKSERKDEKIDIFALGVVFVEMLCRCSTAMERVDMLKGLQQGDIPAELEQNMHREGHGPGTVAKVIELVSCMVDEDPERRWSGPRVREALQDLLRQCQD